MSGIAAEKLNHFGFSTSEDAVTWVVFDYLFRSNRLPGALRHAGLIGDDAKTVLPQLLLWGVPIGSERRGAIIRQQLRDLCHSLGEDPNSFSEPDVIIALSDDALIFIEVKYLSGNDLRAPDYEGWTRYTSATGLLWKIDDVKASGCYELARNWCLLEKLAAGRPATLVNLGPTKLFSGTEGERLDRFIHALGPDSRLRFRKVTWSDFLQRELGDAPDWFAAFCRKRALTA